MNAYWHAANYLSVGQIYLYITRFLSPGGVAETTDYMPVG